MVSLSCIIGRLSCSILLGRILSALPASDWSTVSASAFLLAGAQEEPLGTLPSLNTVDDTCSFT